MRRLRLAVPFFFGVVMAAHGGSGHAQAGSSLAEDNPPSTPGALTSRAYSGTAGALSWQRSTDDNGVRGYEVTRDGVVLVVADRLSHVETSLQPGRSYAYRVVAIDTAGQRSGVAATTLETPPAPGTYPAPTGLRINPYSSSALGLAWARPARFGVRHEVFRDGVLVAETDGTSLVESNLQPGARHVYEVVAIDRAGFRSAPSRIAVTMPGGAPGAVPAPDPMPAPAPIPAPAPGPEPVPEPEPEPEPPSAEPPVGSPRPDTLARLGYRAARDLADALVSTSYLSLYFDIDDDVAALPAPVIVGNRRIDCAPGGRVSITLEQLREPAITRFEFTDCDLAGRRLNGVLERRVATAERPGVRSRSVTLVFGGLRIVRGVDSSVQLQGTSVRVTAETDNPVCPGQPDTVLNISNVISSARLSAASGSFEISDASYNARDGVSANCEPIRSLTFSGLASVVSPVFGDNMASLRKRGQIVRDESGSGTTAAGATADLSADFADGSRLAINALSDVDSRVQVRTVSGGSTETFEDEYRFSLDGAPPL